MAFGVLGQNGNVAVTVETQLKPEIEHVFHHRKTMMIVVHLIVREMKLKPVTALRDAARVSRLGYQLQENLVACDGKLDTYK